MGLSTDQVISRMQAQAGLIIKWSRARKRFELTIPNGSNNTAGEVVPVPTLHDLSQEGRLVLHDVSRGIYELAVPEEAMAA